MQKKVLKWLAYIGLSIIISPVIVFNAGLLMVGEYEGEDGFFGFINQIVAGASAGNLGAWVVLLGPLLLVLIILGVIKAWQLGPKSAPAES